jgi:membrane associated rhomboid family serine protease
MKNSIIRRPFQYSYYNAAFGIIIANVLFFLINSLSPGTRVFMAMNPLYVTQKGYIWQVVTYMFSHASISHILFNMLGLFFFGIQVERRMGSTEFLLFYFISGIGAGIFSLIIYLLSGSYMVWLLGASGAVFAVLLAFATFFPEARIFIFGIFPVKAPYLVMGYAAIELFSQMANVSSAVAHLTHLAGFGFALLYFIVRLGINPIRVFFGKGRY